MLPDEVRQAILTVLDEANPRTPGLAWDFNDDEQRVDFADRVASFIPSETASSDTARLDFLAGLTNLNALDECGAMLTAEQKRAIRKGSDILRQYELHRRTSDTPKAFRAAIDEVMKKVGHVVQR